MGSQGGGNTTQTVQNADPWSGIQPHLLNLYGSAANMTYGYPGGPPPGQAGYQQGGYNGGYGNYIDQSQQANPGYYQQVQFNTPYSNNPSAPVNNWQQQNAPYAQQQPPQFGGQGYYGQPQGQAPTPQQTGWGGQQSSNYAADPNDPTQAGPGGFMPQQQAPQQSSFAPAGAGGYLSQMQNMMPGGDWGGNASPDMATQGGGGQPPQRGGWESTNAYNQRLADYNAQNPQQASDSGKGSYQAPDWRSQQNVMQTFGGEAQQQQDQTNTDAAAAEQAAAAAQAQREAGYGGSGESPSGVDTPLGYTGDSSDDPIDRYTQPSRVDDYSDISLGANSVTTDYEDRSALQNYTASHIAPWDGIAANELFGGGDAAPAMTNQYRGPVMGDSPINYTPYFPGQTYAGLNQQQQYGQALGMGQANLQAGMMPGMMNNLYGMSGGQNALMQANQGNLGGAAGTYQDIMSQQNLPAWAPQVDASSQQAMRGMLSPAGNPHLDRSVQRAQESIGRQFTEGTLQGIEDEAIFSGQYGGSRPALQASKQYEQTVGAMGDVANQMYSGAYQQDQSRALQAGQSLQQNAMGWGNQGLQYGQMAQQGQQMRADAAGQVMGNYGAGLDTGVDAQARAFATAPGMFQSGYAPADMYGQIGSQNQMQTQMGIDEARARWEYPEQARWDQLSNYASILGGIPTPNSMNTAVMGPGPNRAAGAAGGAMTGYSVGGPWGAAAGGLLGYAASS